MHEAKTHLSKLVERVEGGEEIVITRRGVVAQPVGRHRVFRQGQLRSGQAVDTLVGIVRSTDSPKALVRELRIGAGLSQRALARRAETSQPAVARYERGAATPSWETLRRLTAACGWQVRLSADPIPDPGDVELAEHLLGLEPLARLRALRRFARLRRSAEAAR
jgi:transcriptional regulator with XRE-family HTH domain